MQDTIKIENLTAREVLDSRGNPTVEVELKTNQGEISKAIVPSETLQAQLKNVDKKEMLEIRDNDVKRYHGNGVQNAVNNINKILRKELIGMNVLEQGTIDKYMNYLDGTKNKSSLGANAIFGVSMAVARAGAQSLGIPLYQYIGGISGSTIPYPMMSVINGGKLADNNIDIQEFMIVPRNVELFSERMRMCSEVYQALKIILQEDGIRTGVGDEGGFCPNIRDDWESLDFIMRAIDRAGLQENFAIAIDMAASQMYEDGKYHFKKREETYTTEELIDIYKDLVKRYPLIAIEDGLASEDWKGWKKLTNELGDKIHLVGSTLFNTNIEKLIQGVETRTANSIMIKPNQIGTVTETIEMVKFAKANGYMPMMARGLGDSEDTFIADFAVALNLKYIKGGAPVRSECTAKYNQLLRLEEQLFSF
ncbi:MAG: phosphopyruvate hydratase [Clostridia bacterium]|nr:phosphopyruvate hydratase [Clostridia bacterium]